MKNKILIIVGFFLVGQAVFSFFEEESIDCKLEKNCPTSLETIWCEVEVPEGGYCTKTEKPKSVKCEAFYPSGIRYWAEEMLCGEDGGNNPEICDISDPLYWLYCDTFPAL